jgi:peptidoglycan hydrolase-like protein with peptidoglycan-binding domain
VRRAHLVGGAAGLAIVAVAAMALATAGESGSATAETGESATTTAKVSRRDLVLRDDVDGTLGYADARSLAASAPGTVTRLPAEGAVVTRGKALYDVNEQPVRLLYGRVPMWRRLAAGVSDGADVEQLERNLVELGHDPSGMTVDEEFDSDTTRAVKSWQEALGVEETGAVELADAVFLAGPRRVGQLAVAVGSQVQPGLEVMQLTATTPAVTIDLDARRQELATAGDAVRIELPSGRTVRGTITSVGKVAETETTAQGDAGSPTIGVVIRLDEPAKRDGLDGAPVVVSLERERAKGVLAVPVEALLALKGGGMALELVDSTGASRLTAVETGTYADGYVQVEGRGVEEGASVAVPA